MTDAPLLALAYLGAALALVWRGSLVELRPTASHLRAVAGWCAVLIGAAAMAATPVLFTV